LEPVKALSNKKIGQVSRRPQEITNFAARNVVTLVGGIVSPSIVGRAVGFMVGSWYYKAEVRGK
jgi:hypothetical protein